MIAMLGWIRRVRRAVDEHMQIADGLKPPEFLLNERAASIDGISAQPTLLAFLRFRGVTGAVPQ
jgi:hypothetical protein